MSVALATLCRPSADAEGHPLPERERAPRALIVDTARGWIGTPYRHQASVKGVGCDCLGLLLGVWREVTGRELGPMPPYTPDWAEAEGRETFADGARRQLAEIAPANAREGDIVLFRWRAHLPAKHAGILTAPDKMVHAQEGAVVTEVPLNGWWMRRIAYAFSIAGGYGREGTIGSAEAALELSGRSISL
jgi:NlpC/P60 family putative phage cell wall peptidase